MGRRFPVEIAATFGQRLEEGPAAVDEVERAADRFDPGELLRETSARREVG